MSERNVSVQQKTGDLAFTLATWLYLLARAGHLPSAGAVRDALNGLLGLDPAADAEAAGAVLVGAVKGSLGDAGEPSEVEALLVGLFGAGHLEAAPGGDRAATLHALRAYHFRSGLPWLARVVSRSEDGSIGLHWLLVEHVADEVIIMDPYPWDDVEEQQSLPSVDFLVRWELAGRIALRWRA